MLNINTVMWIHRTLHARIRRQLGRTYQTKMTNYFGMHSIRGDAVSGPHFRADSPRAVGDRQACMNLRTNVPGTDAFPPLPEPEDEDDIDTTDYCDWDMQTMHFGSDHDRDNDDDGFGGRGMFADDLPLSCLAPFFLRSIFS